MAGLVTIAPLVLSERLQALPLAEVQEHCLQHLFLTHPDKELGHICAVYVELLDAIGWIGLRCNLVKGFPASVIKDGMETQYDLFLNGVDTYFDFP